MKASSKIAFMYFSLEIYIIKIFKLNKNKIFCRIYDDWRNMNIAWQRFTEIQCLTLFEILQIKLWKNNQSNRLSNGTNLIEFSYFLKGYYSIVENLKCRKSIKIFT